MRTTIRLDDDLLARAKELAARSGRTLTAVVEDALRLLIARRPPEGQPTPVELPTFCGDGLQPGVDLDDTAGLRDHMEADKHPPL